jgi:DnaJ family protein C protein 7
MELAEKAKAQGNQHYKLGNYEDAVLSYTEAIKTSPENAAYYGNRSAAYFMLQRYSDALTDCKFAVALEPGFVKALMRAGKCSVMVGDPDAAAYFYDQAEQYEPQNPSIKQEAKQVVELRENLMMAEQCRENSQVRQAVIFMERAILLAPANSDFKLKKLELLILEGNPDAALTYSQGLVPLFRMDPAFVNLRSLVYYRLGNNEQARKLCSEVLRLDPDHVKAKQLIKVMRTMDAAKETANKLFNAGDNAGAVEAYTQALQIDTENKAYAAIMLANRAAALMKDHKFDRALEDCNLAISYSPDYTRAYLRRANVQMKLENYEEALHDYNKVKQLDPSNRDIDAHMRTAQAKTKQTKKKDYYQILGLEKNATEADIRKSFRKLSMIWHPDKNAETPEKRAAAEKKFKDLAEANRILSDPNMRRKYDSGMSLDDDAQGFDMGGMGGFGGMGGMGGMSGIPEIFQMFMGGQGSSFQFSSGMPGNFKTSTQNRRR